MNNNQGSKWIQPAKRLAIYIRDGFECQYCGRDLKGAAPVEISLDHLLCRSNFAEQASGKTPLVKLILKLIGTKGANDAANLVTACRSCNSSRGNRTIEDFAPGGAQERIARQIAKPLNVQLAKALIEDRAGNPALEASR